jgi:hypothetical protein
MLALLATVLLYALHQDFWFWREARPLEVRTRRTFFSPADRWDRRSFCCRSSAPT